MTSETGRLVRLASRRGARIAGFTMVEVLMVVSIIILLASMLTVAVLSQRKKAAKQATQALFTRLEAAIDSYKELTGHYPADGFDTEVTNDEGTPIRGSACLQYFLTRETRVETKVSGVSRIRKYDPVMELKDGELTEPNEDFPGAREIIDGYGRPIHYDNTEDGEFRAQDGSAHIELLEFHPEDPRMNTDQLAVIEGGVQNPGKYDLWSHGEGGHSDSKDLRTTIGNWKAPAVEESE